MLNGNLIASLLLPNIGLWAITKASMGRMFSPEDLAWFENLKKPSMPPRWTFKLAWTLAYIFMGYAAYLVFTDSDGLTDKSIMPLALYGGQLILNWTWRPLFFGLREIGLALVHILVLNAAATACTISFACVNEYTVYLMAPYLALLGYATYLNFNILRLNKDEKCK